MGASSPLELHALFAKRFEAGDVDGLLALYEEEAVLLPQPGTRLVGQVAIRQALEAFVGLKGSFTWLADSKVIVGDGVALLFAPWKLDGHAPDGSEVHLSGTTSDLVRQQPSGKWKMAIDSPFGADGV